MSTVSSTCGGHTHQHGLRLTRAVGGPTRRNQNTRRSLAPKNLKVEELAHRASEGSSAGGLQAVSTVADSSVGSRW